MKAIIQTAFGGIENLKIADMPTPMPADDEVQIKLVYTAVNPVDWKIREGYLKERIPHEMPFIPGWDAAGIISAIGKKVSKFKVGDEVFAYCRKPVVKWGTYAEYVCVNADYAAYKPKNITFAQTASIPLAGLTSWQALVNIAHLKAEETILIYAGAGGVGSLAIQFAKNLGATVITTASQRNHAYVKSLGADTVIDYQKEDVSSKIKQLAPQGVDVVFDTMGGDILKGSYSLVKPKGRLVCIVEQPNQDLASKAGIKADYLFVNPNGRELQQIADLISKGKVKPPEIHQMNLEQAGEAQETVKKGHTRGKIVLKIGKE